MQILINRTYKNKFYTEGVIKVNGKKIAHTVEDTLTMLPPGTYQIRLCRYKSKRRIIRISSTSWSIGIGLSWIRSEKHHLIAIGQPLIPGVVYKATGTYGRLFERIEKCHLRREQITLIINGSKCQPCTPSPHWTKA